MPGDTEPAVVAGAARTHDLSDVDGMYDLEHAERAAVLTEGMGADWEARASEATGEPGTVGRVLREGNTFEMAVHAGSELDFGTQLGAARTTASPF